MIIDTRISMAPLKEWLSDNAGKRLVVNTGCFDLLHVGHARFFQRCAEQGDLVVILVSADADIQAYKGESRPIIGEQERAEMVANQKGVDLAVIYDGKAIWDHYAMCKPFCIATGCDHADATDYLATLSEYCEHVAVIERCGWSTTRVIEMVLEKAGQP